MQIARNVWRSHSRQVRQYSPLSFTEFTRDNSSRAAQLMYVCPEIEHFAEIDRIQEVFTHLSSLLKEALYFRHVIGLSDAETARFLGISPGAAQKRVYRAETQFRREYDRLTRESG